MNIDNIGIKIDRWNLKKKTGNLSFSVWLFWKNKEYPLNFIGRGVIGIAKQLAITQDEASKILIMKLNEFLVTVTDEEMKVAIEARLKKLRPPAWKTPRTCVGCNKPYISRHTWQKYCTSECRKETHLRRQRVHDMKLEHVKNE